MPRFVIQLHQSKSPHYDFRLERDEAFKSWAVPKGLPTAVGVRRLAIRVEDHSLEFGEFEGTIPDGEYGAGKIVIWDTGTYVLHEWTENQIAITLSGRRLVGRYNLVRFRHKGEREWLVCKCHYELPETTAEVSE